MKSKEFYKNIEVTEKCEARDDVVAITFDFMQNLTLPHIPVQEIFNMRQFLRVHLWNP
jgi:hypothetical protein